MSWMLYLLNGLFVTPWTVACQAPLFVKFSRQENCSGLPHALIQGTFPTRVAI